MVLAVNFFIGLVGVLHCLFFKLESIDFMKAKTLKRFGLSSEEGKVVKTWAFNQGFYNLFLALGLFYSILLLNTGHVSEGKAVASVILFAIVGAATVLFFSAPQKWTAALVQGLPALIGLILLSFL